MSACSKKLFPEKVTQDVQQKLDAMAANKASINKFQLSESMKRAKLHDTVLAEISRMVSNDRLAATADVVRGRQVIQRFTSGKTGGAVCLVVRRPG